MVRAPDSKFGGPGFKSRSDHSDLFHGYPFSNPRTFLVGIFNVYYVKFVYLSH